MVQCAILAVCVGVVAVTVQLAAFVVIYLALGLGLLPTDGNGEAQLFGIGAVLACVATVATFVCTRPQRWWLGSLGICLAFTLPWWAHDGLILLLPAVLAGLIRLATPTGPIVE